MEKFQTPMLQHYLNEVFSNPADEHNISLEKNDNVIFRKGLIGVIPIYKNSYKERIIKYFEEFFPLVCNVLDKQQFILLIDEFFVERVWEGNSLLNLIENFPYFIRKSFLYSKYKFLPDLSLYEWYISCASSTAISEECNLSFLLEIPEEKQKDIIIKLNSSVYLMKSRWTLHKAPYNIIKSEKINYYIIYMNKGSVKTNLISPSKWKILKKISEGYSLGEISLSAHINSQDLLARYFFDFVFNGIISGFSMGGEKI